METKKCVEIVDGDNIENRIIKEIAVRKMKGFCLLISFDCEF